VNLLNSPLTILNEPFTIQPDYFTENCLKKMFYQKTPKPKYNSYSHTAPKIYIYRDNSRFSLVPAITRWFRGSSRQQARPFQVVGQKINVEYGLHLQSQQASSFTSKITIIILSLVTTLPLLWWLNNSNATIATISPWLENPYSLLAPPTPITESNSVSKVYPLNHRHIAPKITAVEKTTPKEPIVKTINELTTYPTAFANNSSSSPWLHLTIKTGDTLSKLFAKHHLNKADLYQMIRIEPYTETLRQLHLNQKIHIKPDKQGNIESLILILNEQQELHLYRADHEFLGEIRRRGISSRRVSIHATIEQSILATFKKAGLSAKKLNQLIEIFIWYLDIERQSQPGDEFSLIYDQYVFEGEKEESDILAAEYIHHGKSYRAIRHTDVNGYTGYYTPMGDSLQKISLLHAPLEYKRISSYFGDRKHPIFRRYSFHTGVDYAAAVGTPIVAGGGGVVKFVGRKGGYGKTIILQHHNRVQTLYAHLYKFEEDLKVDDTVVQGQIIGYVGQSGRATGPHLHYEIQLDDEPIDPLGLENQPLNMPIAQTHLLAFFNQTQKWVNQLNTFNPQVVTAKLATTAPTALLTIPTISKPNALISEKISILKQQAVDYPSIPIATTTATTLLEPRLSR
jgi:murein DD-endopeptidase MepM/ murein hydrolase activator NlpD